MIWALPILASVAPLPAPPVVSHYLFERPWPLGIFLLAGAGAITLLARRAGRPRLRWVGGAVAALALSVVVLGYTVTTTRERLIRRTGALVAATAPMDWPAFHAIVRDDLRVTWSDARPWMGARRAEEMLRRYTPSDQSIRAVNAQALDPTHAYTRLNLRTRLGGKAPGLPMHTLWQLTWRRDTPTAPWRLAAARWLQWEGKPVTSLSLP